MHALKGQRCMLRLCSLCDWGLALIHVPEPLALHQVGSLAALFLVLPLMLQLSLEVWRN